MTAKPTKLEMDQARRTRDPSYDGVFFVGVRTRRIFCRPSCRAKPALDRNVVYFHTLQQAMQNGYRPCKRCHPTETNGQHPEWVRRLLTLSDERQDRRLTDADLRAAGFDPVPARRYFTRSFGMTFQQYHTARRLGDALAAIKNGRPILTAGLDRGYESASGFHNAFTRRFGATPGRSRTIPHAVVHRVESPIGPLQLGATDQGVCLLSFQDESPAPLDLAALSRRLRRPVTPGVNRHIRRLQDELQRYFRRELTVFTTPLDVCGTPFQQLVWDELCRIPYGRTISYGELAGRIGRPAAQRAVGQANHNNPVAIVIPCHRVVQSNGNLCGYGGGLWRKQFLLDLETGAALIE